MSRPGVRLVLILWGVLCCTMTAAGLVRGWETLSIICTACVNPQLAAAAAEYLAGAGIPLPLYAALSLGVSAALALATLGLGVLVALRATHRATPVVVAVLFAIAPAAVMPVSTGEGALDWSARLISTLALAGMFWLFAAFPTLTLSPSWLAVPVAVAGLWAAAVNWIGPLRRAIQSEEAPWGLLEGLIFSAAILAIAIGQAVQYRAAAELVRRQLRMVMAAMAVLGLIGIAGSVTTSGSGSAGAGTLAGALLFHAGGFAVALVLTAIAVSLLRHRALAVETGLSAALTAGVAAAGYSLLYAGTVTGLSRLLDDGLTVVLAVFTASAGLALGLPLVARRLSRQIHGLDDDPADLSASLAQILAAATTPSAVLPAMEQLLSTRLRLPSVAIVQDAALPGPGASEDHVTRVPLRGESGNDTTAAFEVRRRPGQRRLTRRENKALLAAASPVYAGIAATQLSADLEESRAELAAVREEERKTLRQELHDEVVPSLAIVRHRISAARTGGPRTDEHLSRAETTIDAAVDQLRTLARSLRPAALDDLGLEAAIRQFAVDMRTPVTVTSRVDRPLSAIVELVAYRVAVEALLNAERHARASLIRVDVIADTGSLVLTVADDGIGLGESRTFGVGLSGIRERTAELGGEFWLQPGHPSGTRVRVRLPDQSAAS